jgi:acyl CoA:acetate/3-ketoacid CoA transferase alpha subunit
MPFRTIQKSSDTGGLDRERVREAVIRLRDRKRAAAALPGYATRPGTGTLVARERPLRPYGQPAPPLDGSEEGEEQ